MEAKRPKAREGAAPANGGKPRDANAPEEKPLRFLLAGRATGAEVASLDGPLGTVSDLVLDLRTSRVAFGLAQARGAAKDAPLFVVPWESMLPDEKGVFRIRKKTSELEGAPRVKEKSGGRRTRRRC